LFNDDKTKISSTLRDQIKGFDLGLRNVKDEAGFEKMVNLSNVIAHDLQEEHQKDVKEEQQQAPPAAQQAADPSDKHIVKPKPAAVPQDEGDEDESIFGLLG
jgi:hypothetical protein